MTRFLICWNKFPIFWQYNYGVVRQWRLGISILFGGNLFLLWEIYTFLSFYTGIAQNDRIEQISQDIIDGPHCHTIKIYAEYLY